MTPLKTLGLAALLKGVSASYDYIGLGYEPKSNVVDRLTIDLDQQSLSNLVGLQTTEGFADAERVYKDGGNSKSYAVIELDSGLSSAVAQGAPVSAMSVDGDAVTGAMYQDYSAGETNIKIQYDISDDATNHVKCKIGGLPMAEQVEGGCFQGGGEITIDNEAYTYNYNVQTDNQNGRTLRGFSTAAKKKMYDCENCPYPEHNAFFEYYGIHDYGDQWVSAALDGTAVSGFNNYNANFNSYGLEGRAEAAKKGSAYVNVHMYVIREFRDAIDDCKAGKFKDNDDAVLAWDEGVAFYAGSLEGTDGSGSGVMPMALADKRCQNYKTCGALGNEVSGVAKVNIDLFKLFQSGTAEISQKKCSDLEKTVATISSKMYIPLIQGTMRYAHSVGTLGEGEKAKSEGATFAFAVLPMIANCDTNAAKTIAANMGVGASSTSYADVVNAFESTYSCLGISQSDVGRLWSVVDNAPYAVRDAGPASTFSMIGAAVGAVASTVFAFAMM